MNVNDYFSNPNTPAQRRYEALKAFYHDGLSAADAANKFGFSQGYFKKLRFEFAQNLRNNIDPFFPIQKTGPKKRSTNNEIIEQIITLRKQNYSILDIKVALDAQEKKISLNTIDQILKSEGFAPLPKRTRKERQSISMPSVFEAPRSVALEITTEEFTTEIGAGPLIFLPLLENLGIIEAIKKSNFPSTSEISDVQSVLSFLALKLMGSIRWSYDTKWNMDRSLGLFAGLNVLPKASTMSTYSYRVTRSQNHNFLVHLSRIFQDNTLEMGEFNLDFKAIPHWGDASVLEKNWAGARSKAIKSILSLIVQDPTTGNLSYTNADIKHRNQNDAIFEFIDFWKKGRSVSPKMLIFDSKFTTYKNLNKLNKEQIKFLTLRRRSKNLIKKIEDLPPDKWFEVNVERSKRKYQKIRVYDEKCELKQYDGKVRQVILTNHGRLKPTFLITNDFDIDVRDIVKKYARRWLVEQEIAEQIAFFNLNNPSSSIVVKVDFDLTISLLAHNLFRILASHLKGFENCTVDTIKRKFLETGAMIKINKNDITVFLKKKTHLPILFEVPWIIQKSKLSWLDANINYKQGTVS